VSLASHIQQLAEEPGGLQSTELQRIGHDRATERIINVGNITSPQETGP